MEPYTTIGVRGEIMDSEREMLNGYVIDASVWVGTQRVCFGISEDQSEEYPYSVFLYQTEGYIDPVCDQMMCYDNYTEALTSYAEQIKDAAGLIEERKNKIGLADISCLHEKDVIPAPWNMSIKGKVVAVTEKSLAHGYRDISNQLFYVNSGFGVEANSRGRACYGWNLYTGEKCRINRPDVIGIVPIEKLPEFAKKTLEKINRELKQKEREARE